MKRSSLLPLLLLSTALVQAPLALSESHTDTRPAAGNMDDAMDALEELAQPSDEHKMLEATVGEWSYTTTLWPVPGAKPMQSTGEAKSKWVLDGRFVQQVASAEMRGQQFKGIGYTGYDRVTEKYTNVWMDTRGTATLTSSGVYDPETKSITLEGEYEQAGLQRPFKLVLKLDSKDAYTMEMWVLGAYEIPFKNYEIAYTRKK